MKPRPSFIIACIAAISILSACKGRSDSVGVGVTPTQASESPSQAPETQAPVVGIVTETECYTGPGTGYDPVGELAPGKYYQVVGIGDEVIRIDDDIAWLQIDPTANIDPDPAHATVNELSPQPDPPGSLRSLRCWVPRASVDLSGDLGGLPVVEMPLIQLLEPATCRQGAAEENDVERSLDAGAFFRVVGIGDEVIRIDDDIAWLQIDDEPTWFQIDDEPTWFRIDPTAIIDPTPPSRPPAESSQEPETQPRCWVPGSHVQISGDLSQVQVILNPAVLISAEGVLRERYRSPVEVEAVCSRVLEDQPAVRVSRAPAIPDDPTLTIDGEPFGGLCHAPDVGVKECLPLPGDVGSAHTVRTCYPGEACEDWTVTIPTCPEPSVTEVVPVCSRIFEGAPAVRISGSPASINEVRVAVNGEPFGGLCHTPDVGVKECLPLPGDVGSAHTVRTCYPGEACEDWTVTIPTCSEPSVTEVVPVCSRIFEGYYPAVRISGSPASINEVRVAVNGEPFGGMCHAPDVGVKECLPLSGDVGSAHTVRTCYPGEACEDWTVTIPDCGAGRATPTPWRIVSTGCHDEERIYFILETGLNWLIPGADLTYTAYDGVTRYSCEIHPTYPGRVYCSGSQPGGPGQLQVCVQQGSSPRTCNTFLNWRSTVARIGSCAPTKEPSVVDACAAWSANDNLCLMHSGCAWDGSRCYTP